VGNTQEQGHTNQKKNTHKPSLPPGLCGGNLLTMLRCPQRGLSSQSLGKYWQLNQSNQHTSTYSRIQQQTKNPYYAMIYNEYAQENARIKLIVRTDGRSRSLDLFTPRRSPNSAPPLHTLKAPGSTFGGGSPLTPVPLLYYALTLIGGCIKQWCCLTSVCLSYTSGLSWEQWGLGRLKLE